MGAQLLSWLAVAPLAAAMVLVWVGVAYPWLRLAGLPKNVSLGAAPAVSTTLVVGLSVLYFRFGWFWSGARVLPALAIISLIGYYLAWVQVRGTRTYTPLHSKSSSAPAPEPLAGSSSGTSSGLLAGSSSGLLAGASLGASKSTRQATKAFAQRGFSLSGSSPSSFARSSLSPSFLTAVAAAALGFLLAVLPFALAAPATNPVQQWDPTFHMNGVWGMTQLGIGAPGEGLAHNYGGTAPANYPIGWHTFTALFATGPTVVQASNASSLALIAIWIVGVGVFAYVLYPRTLPTNIAMVVAGTTFGMPADALGAYSQWPNAMSVAFLPGVAALAVWVGHQYLEWAGATQRSNPSENPAPSGVPEAVRRGAAWLIVLALAVFGGILAHQVFAFNMAVLLAPALLAGIGTLFLKDVKQRKVLRPAVLLASVAVGAGVLRYVLLRPEVRSMANYPRSGVDVKLGFMQALLPAPPFPTTVGLMIYPATLLVLVAAGILWVLARRYEKRWVRAWPVASFLLFTVLVFFAYGPNWPIRTWIVGPWFNDGRRIMEPQSLLLATFAGLGIAWIIQGIVWIAEKVAWQTPRMTRAGTAEKPLSEEPDLTPQPPASATSVLMSRSDGHGRRTAAASSPSSATASRERTFIATTFVGVALLGGTILGGLDARTAATKSVLDADALGKPGMANQAVIDMMSELDDLLDEDAIVLGDPQAGAAYAQMLGQRWAFFPQLSYLNADKDTQQTLVHRFKYLNDEPTVCEAINAAGITHYFATPDGEYYSKKRSDRSPGLYNVDTEVGFELVAQAGDSALYEITACK